MTFRAAMGWVGVLAVLIGTYWFTGTLERDRIRKIETAKLLFDFEPEAITTLSLEAPGRDTIEGLRNEAGRWSIVSPEPHIPARARAWDEFARGVAALSNERTLDTDPEDMGDYGLDAPRMSIVIGTRSGTLSQLDVGTVDPTQTYFYARLGGRGDVFLIEARSVLALDRSLVQLRDTRVIATANPVLQRLEYSGRSQMVAGDTFQLTVNRDPSGTWRMETPVESEADQKRVNALATEISGLNGRSHIDRPSRLGDYGLAPPFATIIAHTASGPTTLLLGWVAEEETKSGGIFAKVQGDPSVFVIDAHILTLIPRDVKAFRERRLFTRRAERLKSIHYTSETATFTLASDPERGWQLLEADGVETDQVAISRYIALLKHIEGVAFPSDTEAKGLAPPRIRIRFEFFDDAPPAEVLLGAVVPDSVPPTFYARQDNGTATVIPFESFMALKADADTFRSRQLMSFRPARAQGIALVFEGRRYALEKTDKRWRVVEPEGWSLQSQADVKALLEILSTLRASGLARNRDASSGTLDATLDVRVMVASEDGMTTEVVGPLKIGDRIAPNSRTRYAVTEGRREVFHVNQSLIDDIRETLRGIVPGASGAR